jgi:hypothetical protein
MESFEIRKNGELVETIVAHEFRMQGRNAIFSMFGEPQTVIALEPGMRVDRVHELVRYPNTEAIAADFLKSLETKGKDEEQADPKIIEFPR